MTHPGIKATAESYSDLAHIALLIFDCDGVLIDSEPIASRTLAEALNDAGVEITALEAHRRFTGISEREIRRICMDDFGLAGIEGTFAAWHERLYDEFSKSLAAMTGISEVVANLGRPKCVASNSTMERLRLSLGRLPLWENFAPFVFSADSVPHPKPAPDLLLHCAAELGVDPRACVVIDDSSHGISAAVAAGMIAIGFADPTDARIDRLAVLKAAGAFEVVQGARELPEALTAADRRLAEGIHDSLSPSSGGGGGER